MNDVDGTILSVEYARCAGLVVERPHVMLLGEDGVTIRVHPDYWRGGDQAVSDIEAATSRPRSRRRL